MQPVMDEDLWKDVKDIGKAIQDVGRFASSKKRDAKELKECADILRMHAKTLCGYARIQNIRDRDAKKASK